MLASSQQVDWDAPAGPQTPGQWAARWHVLVLFVGFLLLAPLSHLWVMLSPGKPSHRLEKLDTSVDALLAGRTTSQLDEYLEKESPFVKQLRGHWNETRWRLGIFQTQQVHLGKDDWFFLRSSMHPTVERIEAGTAMRKQVMDAIVARCRRLGVYLCAAVVPDKERVYQELAYESGQMPPLKAELYRRILDDLAAAGIPAVDLDAVMRGTRANPGSGRLYYQRDTHWSVHGAWPAALALRAHLEASPAAGQLGPLVNYAVPQPSSVNLLPDLVLLCGFVSREHALEGTTDTVLMPASAVSSQLSELKEYWTVFTAAVEGRPAVPHDELLREAAIALAGSSFSQDIGRAAFAFGLGRALDSRAVHSGASSVVSLAEALDRIESGESKAKVLVWEFVERAWLEGVWAAPAGLLRH